MGIIFSNRTLTLLMDNYEKVMRKIGIDLEKWAEIQLTLLGKIAVIKMKILPRLLFLFQTILITFDRKYFKEHNKHLKKFMVF